MTKVSKVKSCTMPGVVRSIQNMPVPFSYFHLLNILISSTVFATGRAQALGLLKMLGEGFWIDVFADFTYRGVKLGAGICELEHRVTQCNWLRTASPWRVEVHPNKVSSTAGSSSSRAEPFRFRVWVSNAIAHQTYICLLLAGTPSTWIRTTPNSVGVQFKWEMLPGPKEARSPPGSLPSSHAAVWESEVV